MTRAVDRVTRRGRDAAASPSPRGVLKRTDGGDLVPIDAPPAAGDAAATDATGTPGEARSQTRQVDGQGWAR